MTARSGLSELIEVLRGMTAAGTADWSIGTANFFDGDHMQAVLDRYRTDVWHEQLYVEQSWASGGTVQYLNYYSGFKNFEATSGGTAVFIVEDSTGADVGTANYTPDYLNGRITFGSDTGGSVYYLNGRSYDLNAAAADIWRQKAAWYAGAYDISTDSHSLSRGQLIEHCRMMADYYTSLAAPKSIVMLRSDTYDDAE